MPYCKSLFENIATIHTILYYIYILRTKPVIVNDMLSLIYEHRKYLISSTNYYITFYRLPSLSLFGNPVYLFAFRIHKDSFCR